MKSILVPFAVVVLWWSGAALAQEPPSGAHPRAACKADVDKLCPGVQPGGGRIIACLKQNPTELSAACKDALAKQRERRAPGAPALPQG